MDDKVNLDLLDNNVEEFDLPSNRENRFNAKKEWDHLLQDNYEEYGLSRETQMPSINGMKCCGCILISKFCPGCF